MGQRGSLKQCLLLGIESFRAGYSDTIVITGNRAAKYYTLWFRSEFEGKLACSPTFKPRIVMCVTGGELASIIGIGQTQLSLTLPPPEERGEHIHNPNQIDLLQENDIHECHQTLEERQLTRTDHPTTDSTTLQADATRHGQNTDQPPRTADHQTPPHMETDQNEPAQ
jgi:hypothetical protein